MRCTGGEVFARGELVGYDGTVVDDFGGGQYYDPATGWFLTPMNQARRNGFSNGNVILIKNEHDNANFP